MSSSTVAVRSSRTYTTIEATALHESVPPDRWCITRSDLKYLGQEVGVSEHGSTLFMGAGS